MIHNGLITLFQTIKTQMAHIRLGQQSKCLEIDSEKRVSMTFPENSIISPSCKLACHVGRLMIIPVMTELKCAQRDKIFDYLFYSPCSCTTSNYRPQTKFAKVMFSQVSLCPLVGGGGGGLCLPLVPGDVYLWSGGGDVCRHTPGRHPLGRHPPTLVSSDFIYLK